MVVQTMVSYIFSIYSQENLATFAYVTDAGLKM